MKNHHLPYFSTVFFRNLKSKYFYFLQMTFKTVLKISPPKVKTIRLSEFVITYRFSRKITKKDCIIRMTFKTGL